MVRLNGLVVLVGLGCTLRCRDCGNHMPYIPSPHRRPTDIDQLQSDLRLLAGRLTCGTIQIQGGEPLVHPALPEIIRMIHESGLANELLIATSASLPLRDEVLRACATFRVRIRLSDYGLPQQRLDEYERLCDAAGVDHLRYRMATHDSHWLQLGGPDTPRSDDDELVRARFASCPFTQCWTLHEGLISRCSRASSTHLSGLQPFFPADFVNVREAPDTLEARLEAFVTSDRFLESCRYCHGGLGEKVAAGIQVPLRVRTSTGAPVAPHLLQQ